MPGYKSVPEHVVEEIALLQGRSFRIGVRRKVEASELSTGLYGNFAFQLVDGQYEATTSYLPTPEGRWSKWNVNGRQVKRPDWPKRHIGWTTTSPNFGDPARGYSSHSHSREAMAYETLHGKSFAFEASASLLDDGRVAVEIILEAVFDSSTPLDSPDLLLAVSLVREVLRVRPHAFATGVAAGTWAQTQVYDWDFLPVAHGAQWPTGDDAADRLGIPSGKNQQRDTFKLRYEFMRDLDPEKIHYGSSGFSRYIAFEFKRVVILENYYYGNAAYAMFENWQDLSKRTRIDLLADPNARFIRVIHTRDWQARIKDIVNGQTTLGK
ncbi:hypothetical protein LRQ04_00180 [Paenarthrobacter sp. AR 02]|uniref:hypothetical protein n=1 Tax=Paenarthrobacter sp. AR 02 TaxID=2899821 RepID=UPI001F1D0808|nr:hypothetical protein [Paenarthrobacter sp. AR 02]MCF3137659.1 hypothetical protein [Paenarthrobacter sp. AR 02]